MLHLTGDLFKSCQGRIIIKLSDVTYTVDRLHFTSAGLGRLQACDGNMEVLISGSEDRSMVLTIKNSSQKTVRLEEIVIDFTAESFSPAMQAREYRQYIHSRDLENVCHVKSVHMPDEYVATNPESGMLTIFSEDATGHALLFGTLPPFSSAFSYFSAHHESLHMEGRFGVKVRFQFDCDIEPKSDVSISPLIVMEGVGGEKLLEEYGEKIKSKLTRSRKAVATGWNTWDYYSGSISRQDVDENMKSLKKSFGGALKYIVVDDGWECMWGVWQANWKFSEGMEDLCRHIKAAGYVPGIWTAPFMVSCYTPLYMQHPDWFVGDAKGNVYLHNLSSGTMAQLDITRPEVQNHLRQIYSALREWGFEYFKVDFTQMMVGAEKFYDRRIGKAEILRKVFQIIREAIGEDAYLLSCGGPFESVIGIADAFRVSTDIHNYWSMISQNLRCIFARTWMQGTVGNIDPDFLIVRSSETTGERQLNRRLPICPRFNGLHWLDGAEMTMEEAKVLALGIHLCGGDVILGDAVGKLNRLGIDILKKVITPLGSPAKPINLFEPQGMDYPVMLAEDQNEYIMGIFNLTENQVTRKIDLGFLRSKKKTEAVDFWTEDAVPVGDFFELTLPPRSAKGLKFRK
jgi:hypothetical protein